MHASRCVYRNAWVAMQAPSKLYVVTRIHTFPSQQLMLHNILIPNMKHPFIKGMRLT